MAESVDALVSNTSEAIHPGSIPGLGTESLATYVARDFCFYHITTALLTVTTQKKRINNNVYPFALFY